MHPHHQPLEVIVHDEALEEGEALVVLPREREHRQVPGSRDGQHDQGAGDEAQPAQEVPLAGRDAIDERDRARQGEAEQTLRESGEADEAIEGDDPPAARPIGEEDDHQAGHRGGEEAHEDRVGHRLPGQQDEEGRGERRDRAQYGGAARDQPAGGDEEEDGAEGGDGRVGKSHAPLGVDAHPAVGAVGVDREQAGGHQPEVEGGLGEEVRRFPPGVDVVAPRDHLARNLAVVRLPRVPEAGRAQPGHEEEGGEERERDDQPLLARERREPAQPGRLQQGARERVAPLRRRAWDVLRLGCGRVQSRGTRHPGRR